MDIRMFMDMEYARTFLEDIACGAASDWDNVTLFRHTDIMTDPDLRIPWMDWQLELDEILARLRIVAE